MYPPQRILLTPIKDSIGGGNDFAKKSEPDSALKAPIKGKCTVLLVDDEPVLLKAYERALKPLGYEFKTAGNGAQALEIFSKGGIDLVISDVDMPVMNGLEFIRKAREQDPNAKFIFLTGNNSQERVDALLEAGAFEILAKPFDFADLKASVGFALSVGKQEPLTDDIILAQVPDGKEQSKERKHRTILLVEDEEDIREPLSALLDMHGFDVKCASNGKEGLEMARAGGIDLVLSDLNMPVMDGLEMLKAIKAELPGLKVVMQTARAYEHELAARMLEAGAEAVLQKPVDMAYLQGMIAKLI
jgi:CheY-like chemotaxis protein